MGKPPAALTVTTFQTSNAVPLPGCIQVQVSKELNIKFPQQQNDWLQTGQDLPRESTTLRATYAAWPAGTSSWGVKLASITGEIRCTTQPPPDIISISIGLELSLQARRPQRRMQKHGTVCKHREVGGGMYGECGKAEPEFGEEEDNVLTS